MRFNARVFLLLATLVISNASCLNLKEVKNGMTWVPNRFGFPVAVNATEVWNRPQLFFSPESDARFELYTMKNKNKAQILVPDDIQSVKSSNFNKSLPTRIYIHGWQEYGGLMRKTMNDAYFNKAKVDLNVIAVNWEGASHNVNYPACAAHVEPIGAYVAAFIDFLVRNDLASLNDINLIGFSLGAHIAGIAGKQVQTGKLPKIVGLDPAAPLFSLDKPHQRLDKLDAKYVEIIHTSTTWLGFSEPIGSTSFYPNHGKKQVGCFLDPTGTCSHIRSYKYFAESIYSSISFYGHACESLDEMKKGECRGIGTKMGGEPGNYRTEAHIYYLKTNSRPIYARGG